LSYREDLIVRVGAATEDLAWACNGLSQADSLYQPSEDEWPIHRNVAHLLDVEEQVYLPLLRWATLPGLLDPLDYNRTEWLSDRYEPVEPIAELVQRVRRVREEELEIFSSIPGGEWARYRSQDETRWGPLTIQWIAELIYRHTLDHLQQVMALRQDLGLAQARR
jgi:hypothetical protein